MIRITGFDYLYTIINIVSGQTRVKLFNVNFLTLWKGLISWWLWINFLKPNSTTAEGHYAFRQWWLTEQEIFLPRRVVFQHKTGCRPLENNVLFLELWWETITLYTDRKIKLTHWVRNCYYNFLFRCWIEPWIFYYSTLVTGFTHLGIKYQHVLPLLF